MIKQECIGIPDMILLLMKDQSRTNSVPRRGLFLIMFEHCPNFSTYISETVNIQQK